MRVTGTVGDVLRVKGPRVWSISADASVYEAIEEMAYRDVGALLVVNDARVLGVVSERDYTRKVVLRGRASSSTRVRDILSPRPVAVDADTDIADCMRLMSEQGVRYLPVLDGDQVVGLVSLGDLVSWIVDYEGWTIDRLEEYIRGVYPA